MKVSQLDFCIGTTPLKELKVIAFTMAGRIYPTSKDVVSLTRHDTEEILEVVYTSNRVELWNYDDINGIIK